VAGNESEPSRLERELEKLIDSIDLPEVQKQFLRSRWLDQVLYMERAAGHARRRYYVFRLITVLGAVIVPALVSLNLTGDAEAATNWAAFVISLLVAACAAIEGFFHFGMRWRHYRGTVEQLKSEGWAFAQLSGPYRGSGATYESAFPDFVARVEATLGQEVEGYLRQVSRQAAKQQEE
jgi:hypothetical protein